MKPTIARRLNALEHGSSNLPPLVVSLFNGEDARQAYAKHRAENPGREVLVINFRTFYEDAKGACA
jgi:hypothetical protein